MKTNDKTKAANKEEKSKSTHKRQPARQKRVQPLAPKQFIDIIEHINDGLVVLDKDWRYVYVNQKAAVLLQREKPADLLGKHIWTEYPEGVGQPFHLAYERAMREQTPIVLEDHYEPWDLWFENRIYPSPDRLLILFTEITDRKRTARLLEERQHFLQTILDAEPGIVYVYDVEERRNVYVNRFWPLMFGYTQEETQGMEEELIGRIIHPHDLQRVIAHHESWRQAGQDETRHIDYQVCTRQGEWRWLHSREVPFLEDHAGRVKQILGITYDITEHRRTQEAQAVSESELRALLASMNDAVMVIDRHGVYRKIAPTNPGLLYKPPEELLGKTLWDVFPAERAEAFIQAICQVVETQRTRHIEYELIINGKGIWFDAAISPMDTDHTLWMARDITARKEAEEGLRKLNEELEQRVATRTAELAAATVKAQEADKLKSVFLATMSHELRTPLNSIIGFTSVILQGLAGPLNEEQTKQLNMTRNSARHLLALINDVLDISKIEAGQLEILRRPFHMRQAIENALRVVQPLAQKKELELVTFIGPGVETINNDQRRVEQVLINLVGNSIKFTRQGEVSIRCQIKDGWLETSVHDEGIGIKPEEFDKLFKPFQQIDTGLARSHEGTGLGLAICKRLVTAMGGEITVESQWGIGSTFKFTLPL